MDTFQDKKARWLLIPLLLAGAVAGSLNDWASLLLALGAFLFVLLLKGTDLLQKIYFLSIPLSLYLTLPNGSLGVMFPSEPIAGVLFLFIIFNILNNRKLSITLFDHPVSFCFLLVWFGLLIATFSSNMPLVSIKSLLVFTIYLIVFYYQWILGANEKTAHKIVLMLGLYLIGLLVVVAITTFKHMEHSFDRSAAMLMPPPFYSDHTIYGACLAFFIPLLYYWIQTSQHKTFYIIAFLMIATAVFLTYSRAVWISLVVVLGLYTILHFKIRFKSIMITFFSLLALFFIFQESTLNLLSNNRSDSKARRAQIGDQFQSVTNISTDVSNLERINRWKSAWSMFQEKPLTGYGPGTYQFNFIAHQREEDQTSISVLYASNRFSQGMGGTAHSQYLLYASESGIGVVLAFMLSIFFTLREGFSLYYESKDPQEKILIKALLGGYMSFVFHSFFNNFLDIDKAAALFFLFNAAIVAMSIERRKQNIRLTKN